MSVKGEWKFDMVPLKLNQEFLDRCPSHWMGRWRASHIFEMAINGKKLIQCYRLYFKLYEEMV